MTNYDPEVVAVQLNLLGSHDTPRALSVLGRDQNALRLAMLLQATLPGAPCIYYGDEIGMEGGLDPDNRRAYPTGPAPGDQALRTFVRTLLEARRTHVALRRGTVTVAAVGDQAVAMIREAEGHLAVVAVNPGPDPARLQFQVPDGRPLRAATIPDLPSGSAGHDDGEANAMVVELPPSGAFVLVDD